MRGRRNPLITMLAFLNLEERVLTTHPLWTINRLSDEARERCFHPKALGGDKGCDTRDCVDDMRERGGTPHVAQNTSNRRSAIDRWSTRHLSYAVSQRSRKRVEEYISG